MSLEMPHGIDARAVYDAYIAAKCGYLEAGLSEEVAARCVQEYRDNPRSGQELVPAVDFLLRFADITMNSDDIAPKLPKEICDRANVVGHAMVWAAQHTSVKTFLRFYNDHEQLKEMPAMHDGRLERRLGDKNALLSFVMVSTYDVSKTGGGALQALNGYDLGEETVADVMRRSPLQHRLARVGRDTAAAMWASLGCYAASDYVDPEHLAVTSDARTNALEVDFSPHAKETIEGYLTGVCPAAKLAGPADFKGSLMQLGYASAVGFLLPPDATVDGVPYQPAVTASY